MKNIIKMLNHALVCGSVILLFSTLFKDLKELSVYALLTAFIAVVCYIVRLQVQTFISFIISHMFLGVAIFAVSSIMTLKAWYCVVWVFVVLSSIILRLVPQAAYFDEPNYFYVGMEAAIYVLTGALKGMPTAKTISLNIVILLFLLYLLYDNIERMNEFIRTRSIAMELEETRIKRANTRFSLVYIGILGIFLVFFGLARMEGVGERILSGAKKVFLFLLDVIFNLSGEQPEYQTQQENENYTQMLEGLGQPRETSAWLQALEEIIRVMIPVCLAVALIYGLIHLIKSAYRNFYIRKKEEDEEMVRETLMRKEQVSEKQKRSFFEELGQSPAKRIRRIYKKNMKRVQKKNKLSFRCMSPQEQVKVLKGEGTPEEMVEEIRVLYEKARYSTEEVTDKEVVHFRSML